MQKREETMYKRYFVKKKIERTDKYTQEKISIPAGGEITILGDVMYYNGGLVPPLYNALFREMLSDKEIFKKYFKEVPIPYNKA